MKKSKIRRIKIKIKLCYENQSALLCYSFPAVAEATVLYLVKREHLFHIYNLLLTHKLVIYKMIRLYKTISNDKKSTKTCYS
jgi:hypothetical protein